MSPVPRSSRRAAATTCSSSGVDETIWLLAQAERLLRKTEEVRAFAAYIAVLPRRFDDAPVDDLAPEVPAVDVETEHGLVDVLELGDRELGGEQLEAERGVADLAAQPPHGVIDDLAVVERHLHGKAADRVPLLLDSVFVTGTSLRLGCGDDRDVGDRDHVAARVATRHHHLPGSVGLLGPVEGFELLDPAAFEPGDALVQGSRLGIQRRARAMEAAGEGPEAGIRGFGSLAEQH